MVIKIVKPKINKRDINSEDILLCLCIFTPIIQIINSIFLFDSGESNFGKVYRLFTLVVTIIFSIIYAKKRELLFMFMIAIVSLISQLISIGNAVGLVDGLIIFSKFISPYVFICALSSMIKRGSLTLDFFDKVWKFLCIFMPLSMIIPYLLGIGEYRYRGTGYQGLYYENNAVTLVLIAVYIYSIDQLIKNKKISDYIKTILCIVALLMTGSKASILYFAVISIAYLIRYCFIGNYKQFLMRILVIIFILLIVSGFAVYFLQDWILDKIEVYTYYYVGGVLVNKGTVLGFLTNGRAYMADYYIKKYYSPIDVHSLLFGVQQYEIPRVEMDIFDILLYFGLPTVCILIIYNILLIKKFKNCTFMVKFMFVTVLVYGALAGHVWDSSLAGLIMILVYALVSSADYMKTTEDSIQKQRYFKT